jgi:hypothetical protein
MPHTMPHNLHHSTNQHPAHNHKAVVMVLILAILRMGSSAVFSESDFPHSATALKPKVSGIG